MIDAARALASVADETRLLQNFEMLRHGRPADRKSHRNLANRARAVAEPLEHGAARGIVKSGENAINVIHHLWLVGTYERVDN